MDVRMFSGKPPLFALLELNNPTCGVSLQVHIYGQNRDDRNLCYARATRCQEIPASRPGPALHQLLGQRAQRILDHSRFFNEQALVHKSLKEIEDNTKEALTSDDFMAVSKETLSVILDSDKLSMDELQIFKRSFEWAKQNVTETSSVRDVLGDCLFKIRFPVIPMQEFTEEVCSKDILNKDEQLELLKYMAVPKNTTKLHKFHCKQRKSGKCLYLHFKNTNSK